MQQPFTRQLKRMKSELTALKTAHKRGLGLIDFYRTTASWTVVDQTPARITATAKSGAPVPFFCQLSANIPKALQLFSGTSVSGQTITWDIYESYFNAGQTLTIEVISTVELSSLTIEAI